MKNFGSPNSELFPENEFRDSQCGLTPTIFEMLSQTTREIIDHLDEFTKKSPLDSFSPRYFLESIGVDVEKIRIGNFPSSKAVSYSKISNDLSIYQGSEYQTDDRRVLISNFVHEYLQIITSNYSLRDANLTDNFIFSSDFQRYAIDLIRVKGIDISIFSRGELDKIKALILRVFNALKTMMYEELRTSQGMQVGLKHSSGRDIGILYSLPDTFGQTNEGNMLIDYKLNFNSSSLPLVLQFGMYALVSDLTARRVDRMLVIEMENECGEVHFLKKMNLATFLKFILCYLDLIDKVNLPNKARREKNSVNFKQSTLGILEEVGENPILVELRNLLLEFQKTCEWESSKI
jgi:hypothetical protein